MRVSDHVYILSGSYFGAVNNQDTLGDVYGIRTGRGVVLIDCGIPGPGPARIRKTLAEWGVAEPVTHLILTHAHFDHAGGGRAFQDAGALVIVGAEDAAYCEAGGSAHIDSPFPEQDYPAFTPDIRIEADREMELDGVPFTFYKTPGHTRGSLCALANVDGKAVLFTGDALQPGGRQIDEVAFGWQGDGGFDRRAVVSSMEKLSRVPCDMVLPGHGKACVDNGSALLRFAYRQALLTMR